MLDQLSLLFYLTENLNVSVEDELSLSSKAQAGLFQGFALVPALYSLCTNDTPAVSGYREGGMSVSDRRMYIVFPAG